jgi:hypothetical protein
LSSRRFSEFFQKSRSPKALCPQSLGFGSSSALSSRDQARFATFACRFILRTDICCAFLLRVEFSKKTVGARLENLMALRWRGLSLH